MRQCLGVWVAETVAEDVCIRNSSLFRSSMRVRYGRPAPRFSMTRFIIWGTHFDDVLAWILGRTPEEAKEREASRGLGLLSEEELTEPRKKKARGIACVPTRKGNRL